MTEKGWKIFHPLLLPTNSATLLPLRSDGYPVTIQKTQFIFDQGLPSAQNRFQGLS